MSAGRKVGAVELKRATVAVEWKADPNDPGTLVGYLATWDLDLGGDQIERGAFKKTIAAIRANGIPLLADHKAATTHVLGTIYDAAEDSKGLKIWARLSAAPSAQDVRIKLVEGHLRKMSIGYEAMGYRFGEAPDGSQVRFLLELKLYEGSVVVFPMNTEAAITEAKSLLAQLSEPDRAAVLAELAPESKATVSESRTALSEVLRAAYGGDKTFVWVRDFDEAAGKVWFDVEEPDSSGTYEHAYSVDNDGGVTLEGDRVAVRAVVTYKPIGGGKATLFDCTTKTSTAEVVDATGDEPGAHAGDDPAEIKSHAAGDEPVSAPDEGVAGWDRWGSAALLAGRPDGEKYAPDKRAYAEEMLERLEAAG
jgi:HK97 family phage prohead protease